MAYSLELSQAVKDYIRNISGLSRQGRIKLFAGLHEGLALVSDAFRADPANRLGPESRFLEYRFLFRDKEGDAAFHLFRFIVDDFSAAFGVLKVIYVDSL